MQWRRLLGGSHGYLHGMPLHVGFFDFICAGNTFRLFHFIVFPPFGFALLAQAQRLLARTGLKHLNDHD